MWQIIGIGAGVALAMGMAGSGRHWAVRVLCGVLAVNLAVAVLAVAVLAGKASPAWPALFAGVLGFVVSLAFDGARALVATLRKNRSVTSKNPKHGARVLP